MSGPSEQAACGDCEGPLEGGAAFCPNCQEDSRELGDVSSHIRTVAHDLKEARAHVKALERKLAALDGQRAKVEERVRARFELKSTPDLAATAAKAGAS